MAPPRAGAALGVFVALAAVGAMVIVKPEPLAPGFVGNTAAAPQMLVPAAPRPLRAIDVDVGVPLAREHLVSGFGPDEVLDDRSVSKTLSGRALIALPLSPDRAGATLSLLARTAPGIGPHSVRLSVNGGEGRALSIPSTWAVLKMILPESSLASGRNQFEFSSPLPSGGLVLDQVRLESNSTRVELNVGVAATRPALIKGWGSDETIGGRSAARLRPPSAELSVQLHPLASEYVIGVVAMSESKDKAVRLSVEVNGARPGLLAPAEHYEPSFVRIPRSALRFGENSIKLGVATGAHFALDYLSLRPLEPRVFLDIGTPEARQNLTAGFSVDEAHEFGTSTWSDAGASQVVVWLKPEAVPYRLSVRASALVSLAPLSVATQLNGKVLGSFMATEFPSTHALEIPKDALRDGANVLELKYGATGQPSSANPRSRDTRHLALRYDWLEIVPNP